MDLPPLGADVLPLYLAPPDSLRFRGTRVPIETVLAHFASGATPEEIVSRFDTLDLADVYTVIGWYLRHQAEVDAYLAGCEREAEELRALIEGGATPNEIAARTRRVA